MEHFSKRGLHGLLPLLVLSLFALCAVAVLLSGADAYRSLSQRDDASYTQRTAAGYISTKIHQTAQKELITVESFGDGSCLCLPSTYSNEKYITRLYCFDGKLCELFTLADILLTPQDGEVIVALDNFSCTQSDGLLTLRLASGEKLHFSLGEEAAR